MSPLFILAACTGATTFHGTTSRPDDSGAGDTQEAGTADSAGGAPDTNAPPDTAIDTGTSACTRALELAVDGAPLVGPLELGTAPARAAARTRTFTVHNPCDATVRFLGHPDTWLAGEGFSLAGLPPVALEAGDAASLTVAWSPGEEGPVAGGLRLPHDGPESPLVIDLAAQATSPLTVVFVGDGAHLATTRDYATTFAHDAYTTLEAHTAALIRGVCAGAGGFLAVGGNAERAWWTSADGVTWTGHVAAGAPLGACAWGPSGFVAFDGAPLVSTDGTSWIRGEGSSPRHLRAMTRADGAWGTRFVAVGDGGAVAVTEDGARWLAQSNLATDDLGHVAAGDGRVVAAGANGRTAASRDGGVTWVLGATGGTTAQGLVWTGDTFLLGDGTATYRSGDGIAWTRVNAARPAPRAVVGRQVFGTVGLAVHVSEDGGFSWTERLVSPAGLGLAHATVEVRE